MTLFAIPRSWAWTTLGEIAEVVGGVTKDSKKQSDPSLPMAPYLRVANVQRGYLDLTNVATIRVPEPTLEKLRLMPGDVLLNEGGDRDKLGRGWVWQGNIPNCIHQNHVFRARIIDGVLHPKLLALFANECGRDWFERQASQTVNLASISLSKIKQLPVPVPPPAEQHRIVAALDDYLSRLDAAEGLTTSAAARAGKLLDAVLESEVRSVSGAVKCELGSLLHEPLRNGHSARVSTDGQGIRAITLTAVTRNDFSEENTKITSATPTRVRELWLEKGDILIQRSNTPELVGTAALYSGPHNWAVFPDLLIRVRVDARVLPEYILLILRTRSTREFLRSSAKGLAGSMPKIDQATILRIEVPVPPISEQNTLVARMNNYYDSTNRTARAVEQTTRRSRNLRRSLLAAAFSGRLVPQDPGGEPVSVLLDRIRQERKARPKPQRRRRTASVSQEEALL